MEANDITTAGVYWYFDAIGADGVAVEVGPAGAARADWEVLFFGRADADRLSDLSGTFLGPVQVPPAPTGKLLGEHAGSVS
jgi:hypothetical protein